jgi:hypothetical protein
MAVVYKTKPFAWFARKEGIGDADLCRAAADVAAGRVDADLGGGVIKQRVARAGAGKSGGYRTIVLFRVGPSRLFFVYGFAKSSRANISGAELEAFRRLANRVLAFSGAELMAAIQAGELIEVDCDGDKKASGREG